MISQSINLLDNRIANIAQFHELNSLMYETGEMIDLKNIEKETRRMLDEYENLKNIELNLHACNLLSLNISGEIIRKFLSLFIKAIAHFEAGNQASVSLHFSKFNSNLKAVIELSGFYCIPELRGRLEDNYYSIEAAIKDDSVLRFYILYNHIVNYDGKIAYTFLENGVLSCQVLIPL